MFSRITKKGSFELSTGVKSSYNYDYSLLTDEMSAAYCEALKGKLNKWQAGHSPFSVVIGTETEGVRIGYQLSKMMGLPFHIMPKTRLDFDQLETPSYPSGTHWLIVDDIVTTGSTFLRAMDYLEIDGKTDRVTFACMVRRNPKRLDYSAVRGDPSKSHLHVRDERFDFIDKNLVYLYSEPQ